MNRSELQVLSLIRIAEAKVLQELGMPGGAYYLAGYALECALKARIAKRTRRHDFPDKKTVDASHTHSLRELMKLADLDLLRRQQAVSDPVFSRNWDLVQEWSEQSRYRRYALDDSRTLIEAISSRRHGVLPWIKRHW